MTLLACLREEFEGALARVGVGQRVHGPVTIQFGEPETRECIAELCGVLVVADRGLEVPADAAAVLVQRSQPVEGRGIAPSLAGRVFPTCFCNWFQ